MKRVVVTGHVCVDLQPRADRLEILPGHLSEVGPLRISVGGSVANTGITLARLGHEVDITARVGADDLGVIASRHLAAVPGVRPQLVTTSAAATSYSVVVEPADQDRSFWHHVGANALYDGTEADVEETDLVHLGYPSLLPALTRDGGIALRELLERARRAGATTSLDLAVVDPDSASGSVDWSRLFSEILPFVDVITPSADDLRSALDSDASAAEFAEMLCEWGVAVAVVSDGPAGLHIATGSRTRISEAGAALASSAADWADRRHVHPARPLQAIVTTNGAGDAASAGFLSGLLRGEPLETCAARSSATAAAVIEGAESLPIAVDTPLTRIPRSG